MGSSPTAVHRAQGEPARAPAPGHTGVRGRAGTGRGRPALVRARPAGDAQGSLEDCKTKRVARSKVARRIKRLLRRMHVGSEDCRLGTRHAVHSAQPFAGAKYAEYGRRVCRIWTRASGNSSAISRLQPTHHRANSTSSVCSMRSRIGSKRAAATSRSYQPSRPTKVAGETS